MRCCVALFVICFLAVSVADAEDSQAPEFRPLFNGENLEGWTNPYQWGEAWVEDGVIHLRGNKKFFLITEEEFGDFILEAEVMLPPEGKSNSGIMFRAQQDDRRVFGYQAECDPSPRAWTGGLYDEGRRGWLYPNKKGPSRSKKLVQAPLGEWIGYRIKAEGDELKIEINGKLTTEYTDDEDASGQIGLQHHGEDGQIYRFRNVRIAPLD